MISGTDFFIREPELVAEASRGLRRGLFRPSDIKEIQAECEADKAMCLACEDGMVVVQLQAQATHLELFVLLAIAFRHGAFERQLVALLQIARELDAKTIAFGTRRRGWARRLGPEWTRRGSDEFVRLVNGQEVKSG